MRVSRRDQARETEGPKGKGERGQDSWQFIGRAKTILGIAVTLGSVLVGGFIGVFLAYDKLRDDLFSVRTGVIEMKRDLIEMKRDLIELQDGLLELDARQFEVNCRHHFKGEPDFANLRCNVKGAAFPYSPIIQVPAGARP